MEFIEDLRTGETYWRDGIHPPDSIYHSGERSPDDSSMEETAAAHIVIHADDWVAYCLDAIELYRESLGRRSNGELHGYTVVRDAIMKPYDRIEQGHFIRDTRLERQHLEGWALKGSSPTPGIFVFVEIFVREMGNKEEFVPKLKELQAKHLSKSRVGFLSITRDVA